MAFDHEVSGRSAEEGARRVARGLLATCDAEAERLARAADDPEALHDFRVALRRLRTVLRAFRPLLGGRVRRKAERRLRQLARATNAARDAEVQLAWLSAQEPALTGRGRRGLEVLRQRIAARQQAAGGENGRLRERYARAARALARQLEGADGSGEGSAVRGLFGAAVAKLLAEQLGALRAALERATGAADQEGLHRARIEAKRLRYLAEPLRGHPRADSRRALKRLKALQDVLGELNDSHVLAAEIGAAMADLAAERARRLHAVVLGANGAALRQALRAAPTPGVLLPVLDLVRERRDALYAELQRSWRGGGVDDLAAEVLVVAGALEPRTRGRRAADAAKR